MINIFYSFFANSLNITFFIIIMVLLQPFLKKFISAVCLYRIWVVLLIGLLIPVHIGSPKALFYISSPRIAVENKGLYELDVLWGNKFHYDNKKDSLQKPQTQDTGKAYHNTQGIRTYRSKRSLTLIMACIVQNRYLFLCLLWILGVIFLLTVNGIQYYKYLKLLNRFILPVNHEDLKQYESIQKIYLNDRNGLKKSGKIMLHRCSIISSPMTIGVFKPTILLPDESYSSKDSYYILKHELIHIQRSDSMVKLIRLIVLAFYWYNPFCYVLSRHLNEWCEISCDELVMNNSTKADRLEYSKLLLNCIATEKKTTAIFNMIGGKNNMKNRLCSIIDHRKKFSSKMLIALLLCIVFTTAIVSVSYSTQAAASGYRTTAAKEPIVQSDKIDKTKSDKVIDSQNKGRLSVGKAKVQEKHATASKSKKISAADKVRKRVVEYAISKEKLPYMWGGTDLSEGVDAGGFIQSVYKKFDYDIARTTMQQAATCKKISLDSLKPGDLIFYADHDHKVDHGSIYIGCNKIIHAKNTRTGVIIEDMNYRKPYTAGRVISD